MSLPIAKYNYTRESELQHATAPTNQLFLRQNGRLGDFCFYNESPIQGTEPTILAPDAQPTQNMDIGLIDPPSIAVGCDVCAVVGS